MSDEKLPREADVAEVSSRLDEGLKNCRAMIANYRAMLGAESNDNSPAGAENGLYQPTAPTLEANAYGEARSGADQGNQ